MLKKKTLEISLLKFENAEIFYITPKNQLWAIFNTGLKKCIKKSFTDVKKLPNFFENKNFITYKDSKKIKKGIKFKIFVNGVNIYFKTKKIHIEFLNKQNIIKDKKFQQLSVKKNFTFVDLFSGAGGFSLGLKMSGLKHIYGVDSWVMASKTYSKNIGFNICKDLQVLKPVKLSIKVDILVGSPPCQSFSLANRRNSNTSEGVSLYLSFLDYLKFYKPKVFVLENVFGLLSFKKNKDIKVIDEMIQAFSIEYHVRVFKICCSDFGVPQKRKRVLIIGVQKDFGEYFPDLKKSPCKVNLRSLLLSKKEVSKDFFLSKKALSGILRRQIINRKKGNGFGAHYLNLDSFCNTITANYWKDGYSSLIKYNETTIRRLTELELKRVQSFPDTFNFSGSKKEKYIQIGNAVPPKLAYFIGKEIIKFLEKDISENEK